MNGLKKFFSHSIVKNLLKITFVVTLLYYLAERGFLSLNELQSALQRWDLIAVAFTLLFSTALLTTIRWHYLLKALNIHLPWQRTLQLQFVGNFFNIALPGAVSGDVVKAIYVAREGKGKRAHCLSSILFDRVAGVSALVLYSAGALILSLSEPWGLSLFKTLAIFIVTSGVGILSFYAYLFLVKDSWDPLLKLFILLEKKYSWFGSFTRIYEGLRKYHNEKKTVILSLVISFLIHSMVILACQNFALAFGQTQLPTLGLFVVVPLGLVLTAVPITPAGVGTGHAAFLAFFSLIGSERGADIFNLFLMYKIFEGTIGGLIYLKFKSSEPLPDELAASFS